MENICEKHQVPLKAAALQYPLQFKNVKSVIPGSRSPEEAMDNCNMMKIQIPDQIWEGFRSEKLII